MDQSENGTIWIRILKPCSDSTSPFSPAFVPIRWIKVPRGEKDNSAHTQINMLHDEPSQCSSSTDLTLSGASLCIRAKSANSDGWDYESSLEPAALQFSAGVDNSEIPPSPPHVPGDQYQTQASANEIGRASCRERVCQYV